MATRVKGVTIELSADATGIEQALKEVNKSLKSTQFQLREVEKSLRLDPGNLELIEQKQRLLAKATEETKKKLEALKAAQEDMKGKEATDENWKQYDALTREISKTQKELDGLNEEQKKFTEESNAAQSNATLFAAGLSKVSEAADKVAEKMAVVSAAAASALSAMVMLVGSSAQTAAGWKETADEIGFTAEGIQKLEYASAGIGVEMDDMTGAIQNMNKNAEESEGVFKKIGVRVQDNNGEYKNSERIFNETVSALGQIESETERNQAATAIFGENARKIAPAFEDGGAALRSLGNEAESLGGIVSEDEVESLARFSQELNKVKVLLAGAFANVGASALEALAPAFQVVADAAAKFAQIISNVPPQVLQVIAVVLLIIAAITPISRIISGIIGSITSLIRIVPMVVASIEMIGSALASISANPVVLVVAAIIAALALLAVGIYEIVDNWDAIKSSTANTWNSISSAVQSGVAGAKSNFDKFTETARSAFDKAAAAVERFKDAVDSMVDSIKSKLDKIKDTVNKFKDIFSNMGSAIKESLNLGDLFGNVGGDANSAGARIMNAFAAGITGAISAVKDAINQLSNALAGLWDSLTGQARAAGMQTANAYAAGYGSGAKPNINNYSPLGTVPNGGNYYTPNGANGSGGVYAGELLGAISELNSNMERLGASGPANINVMLSGSAANIFDTVQVQNSRLIQATGYHALT